jgi:hypothetical protein
VVGSKFSLHEKKRKDQNEFLVFTVCYNVVLEVLTAMQTCAAGGRMLSPSLSVDLLVLPQSEYLPEENNGMGK